LQSSGGGAAIVLGPAPETFLPRPHMLKTKIRAWSGMMSYNSTRFLRFIVLILLSASYFGCGLSAMTEKRVGRAYTGCTEKVVMEEETVYEEEMHCHEVFTKSCMVKYNTVFKQKEVRSATAETNGIILHVYFLLPV
jgi:hypothetical protein